MKTYRCTVCGYISFNQAPIKCPVCKVPIENFDNNPEAIRRPEDPGSLSEMEKKHIPLITVSKECGIHPDRRCIAVHVMVGEIEHVMESEHFISWIDFYINERYLARVHLTYKRLHPSAELHLTEDKGMLKIIENCTIHGSWMAESGIE